jgi:hypothetical protein
MLTNCWVNEVQNLNVVTKLVSSIQIHVKCAPLDVFIRAKFYASPPKLAPT